MILSERNIRIFDLCYFLLGVLSEEEKLEIDRKQWIQFSAKLFEGYESKIKLKKEEKSSVPYVMESIELLFTAYFTKCDDVKCAKKAFDVYKFICSKENEIRRYLKFDNM